MTHEQAFLADLKETQIEENLREMKLAWRKICQEPMTSEAAAILVVGARLVSELDFICSVIEK